MLVCTCYHDWNRSWSGLGKDGNNFLQTSRNIKGHQRKEGWKGRENWVKNTMGHSKQFLMAVIALSIRLKFSLKIFTLKVWIYSWNTTLFIYLHCLQPGLRAKVRTASIVLLSQLEGEGRCSAQHIRVHSFFFSSAAPSLWSPLPTYIGSRTLKGNLMKRRMNEF